MIADADGSTSGTTRTVSLAEGSNAITATVTAADLACDAGGVRPADGRRLSAQAGMTVPGPTASSPLLADASVSGVRLTLSYDRELDGGSTPSPPDFVVLSGSKAVSVRSLQVAGATATAVRNETPAGAVPAEAAGPIPTAAGIPRAALIGRGRGSTWRSGSCRTSRCWRGRR